MIFPALSVSAIGLALGLIFVVTRQSDLLRTLLIGLLGAWLGFAAGGLCGLLIDVFLQSGNYLAIIGHAAALAGAFGALLVFRPQ